MMLTSFVIAEADGVIFNICSSSMTAAEVGANWPRKIDQGLVFLAEALSPPLDNWRIVDGAVIQRAAMAPTVSTQTIAADGVSESVISGLPDPCVVTIRGAVSAGPVEVTGGTLSLTSTAAGAIVVAVRADPTHKPWEATINAA